MRHEKIASWWQTTLQLSAVFATALVAMATSPAPFDFVPGWIVAGEREFQLDGVKAKVWVSKNGPAGVGFTIRMHNYSSQAQTIEIKSAILVVGRKKIAAAKLPSGKTLERGDVRHVYLSFLSNERQRASNEKQTATLNLTVRQNQAVEKVLTVTLLYGDRCYYRNSDISDLSNCRSELSDTGSGDGDTGTDVQPEVLWSTPGGQESSGTDTDSGDTNTDTADTSTFSAAPDTDFDSGSGATL